MAARFASLWRTPRGRRVATPFALAVGALVLVVGASGTNPPPKASYVPPRTVTSADAAREKLQSSLRAKLDAGSKEKVYVHTLVASRAVPAVTRYLEKSWVARQGAVALVLGRTSVPKTLKIAGLGGVSSVDLVSLGRTGEPLDVNEGQHRHDWHKQHGRPKGDVPFPKAPPVRGSRFAKVKDVNLLDAKTHNFRDAWAAGYDGAGVTVGVLDGGTDFGHPDLLGTWKTWDGGQWDGWPMAFDPYGTLVFLLAPDLIDTNATFYTRTQVAGACVPVTTRHRGGWKDDEDRKGQAPGACTVDLDARLGPARNFSAPDQVVTHTYKLKSAWSKSGVIRYGAHPDDYLLEKYGERPAFVVVDSTTPGVYDTVYVDLNDNQDFTDEKPVSKASPSSYRDLNGDGYTDISGGLLAYVSDGATSLPGGITEFLGDDPSIRFDPGEMLMWSGDFDPAIEGHGTLTASNIVGQGVVTGGAPEFSDLRERDYPGVIGGAPNAKLAPFSDVYFGFSFSTQFGYWLTNVNGVDITSNSYGTSETDNDGFDAASIEADLLHRLLGGHTVPLFSTGNGGPGYGTITSPKPSIGINVAASTQFGGTGWDSIKKTSQIVDNDIIEWSNRGPSANADAGVDVVADGAFSPGDKTLNTVGDGRIAWETWGGTSRSTPVAAAASALVLQSYVRAGGTPDPELADIVKRALKSSARDLGYDSLTQGAGSIDAGRAVRAAAGTSLVVAPDAWRAGAPIDGEPDYLAFPNSIAPGGSSTKTFEVGGGSPASVSDRYLKLSDSEEFPLVSKDQAQESPYTFQAPDYLYDLTSRVKAHSDADLLVIRVNFKRSALDPNNDYKPDQAWRLLPYNWTDVNHDGRLWKDKNGNGIVNHTFTDQVNIDDNNLIDYSKSEIEKGEYIRFMYHRPDHNALVSWVGSPGKRMADGLFLGLQHSIRSASLPTTEMTVRLEWYKNTDWPWLTTTPVAGGFNATLDVPDDAAPGMYQGAVVVESADGSSSVVPVTAAVTPTMGQAEDGTIDGSLNFGGVDQSDLSYDNGSVFGASDWTWRSESGDWRFFFFNLAKEPAPGSLLLAETSWDDPAPATDIDTLIMGPSANDYGAGFVDFLFGPGAGNVLEGLLPEYPYALDTTGKSPNTDLGSGIWGFNTSSGGNSDVVASPLSGSPDVSGQGLHSIVWHQVGWDGGKFHVPVKTKLYAASVNPSSVALTVADDTGSFDVTFDSVTPLGAISAAAFGLGQETAEVATVNQDDPDDITTASLQRTFTVSHAARVEISVDAPDADDVDLYVMLDGEVVASSATAATDEAVTLIQPEDGEYTVLVHGFTVNPSPANVTLTTKLVQGTDLTTTVTPAGNGATIHVAFDRTADPLVPGETYFGELLLGPASAPTAVSVPIEITRGP